MDRTGLCPRGQEHEAVRWVAIRHADDHVHIVALLARQDGGKAFVWRDFFQVADACHAAEQRYGLTPTPPCDRTAARRPTRAKEEKAGRHRRAEPPRVTLRRHVATAAAAASSEQESFALLEQVAGVRVRLRYSSRDPGQVTGYAIGLDGDTGRDGQQLWYGGCKLAADLTLPKLRARWHPARAGAGPRGDAGERNATWDYAARTAAEASTAIGDLRGTDPAAASDIAWAAADVLRAAAAALGSPALAQAADAYDRAARQPWGGYRRRLWPGARCGRPPGCCQRPRTRAGTGRWPSSRSWCGWWRWLRRSASCAPPSSAPPRPPPHWPRPATSAPPQLRQDRHDPTAVRPSRGGCGLSRRAGYQAPASACRWPGPYGPVPAVGPAPAARPQPVAAERVHGVADTPSRALFSLAMLAKTRSVGGMGLDPVGH